MNSQAIHSRTASEKKASLFQRRVKVERDLLFTTLYNWTAPHWQDCSPDNPNGYVSNSIHSCSKDNGAGYGAVCKWIVGCPATGRGSKQWWKFHNLVFSFSRLKTDSILQQCLCACTPLLCISMLCSGKETMMVTGCRYIVISFDTALHKSHQVSPILTQVRHHNPDSVGMGSLPCSQDCAYPSIPVTKKAQPCAPKPGTAS